MNSTPWLKASRLPSQSYIFFPLLLGQGLSVALGQSLDWTLFLCVHLYGLFIQLYIVYANDYADIEVDQNNKTFNMFSGGSRTIVEGLISKKQMMTAIVLTMVANCLVGFYLLVVYQRSWFFIFLIASWLLLWMYSYGPVKLSYRGGGELLQMLGVGFVLPLVGFYVQQGTIESFPWVIMLIIIPIQLAAAMVTSIPDEPSDRQGGKRTSAALLGATKVKHVIIVLYGLSFILLFSADLLGWSIITKTILLLLPLLLCVLSIGQIAQSPAGSVRSNRFVTLMVTSVVFFMAGLAIKSLV